MFLYSGKTKDCFVLVSPYHILKIQYLTKEAFRAEILWRFFIPHRGLPMAKIWALKSLNTSGASLVSYRKNCDY
jgi:hypothetical protein